MPGLPEEDTHARYVEVDVAGLRIGNLYLPNGNSNGDAGYALKLRFMDCLYTHAAALLGNDTPLILAGGLQCLPRGYRLRPRRAGQRRRAAAAGDARTLLENDLGRPDRRHTRHHTQRPRLYLLGLPGRLLGQVIAACASTMPC